VKSKLLFPWLSIAVIALLIPVQTWAQGCAGVMTPRYSSYTSNSVDNNNYIYATIGVDGYTSIGNTEYCNITGTTHRPEIYNMLNTTGGYYFGSSVSPASYISFSNTQDIIGQPGVEYPLNDWAAIICSAVGTIYNSGGGGDGFISLHRTTYKYGSILNNVCTFNVYCINTTHICGPDSVTVQGPCPYTYFITSWFKFRVGSYSTCFPGPTGVLSNTWLSCF
jgi:hypothetical protein